MEISRIERVNFRHQVDRAVFFTQDWFRRKNGLDPKLGLCAALVQLWWASVREGEDGIERLQNATPALVKEIINRQSRSFYFRHTPTEEELDEESIYWLNAKYGKTELCEIQLLCDQYGAQELLEIDLIREHQAAIIARHKFSHFSPALLDAFTAPTESGLRLLLLRYTDQAHRGGQSGHRVALAVFGTGRCKFFDPNSGEMSFNNLLQFKSWFEDFWQSCDYKSRIEQPVADISPLRLYRFAQITGSATEDTNVGVAIPLNDDKAGTHSI